MIKKTTMRKLILFAFIMLAGQAVFAQNFDDVVEKIKKQKFGEAKEKLDKMASDPKALSNSDYWFYKAQIYKELGKATSDSALMAGSLDAIKKYFDIESKQKDESRKMLKSLLESHQTAFDIYSNYFAAGVKNFQAENWRAAYNDFTNALDAFNQLSKYKITNVPFDTTATLYAGYSAQNGKMVEDAVKYYNIIADKKIVDPNYIGVYEYLVSYYQSKKDAANAAKYLALGKQLYPNSKNWTTYELADLDADKSKKMSKLAELTKQDPNNYDVWMEYAFEMFNYIYGKDKPADYVQKQDSLTSILEHLISIKESPYSYYIMTQHLNNQIYDMQQAYRDIKGTKPEDVKKKTQLNKDVEAKYEILNKNASAAADLYSKMTDLKPVDKANYRWVLNQQADYYRMKKQPAKAKEYEDKANALK
jgi:hypothetical protein